MRIILTQNVLHLGSLGDEVSVKDGYARNFLLPRGLAMPATGKNAKAIQHRRKFLETQRADAIGAARGEAEKVAAIEIVVRGKAGTGGRLFGSITNRDLQAAFSEQGYELDRKAITLHAPVKTLGTFSATVRLHTDVKVDFDFRVEASEIVATPKVETDGEPAEGADGEAAAADDGAASAGEGAPAASAGNGADATPEAAAGDAPQAQPDPEPKTDA